MQGRLALRGAGCGRLQAQTLGQRYILFTSSSSVRLARWPRFSARA